MAAKTTFTFQTCQQVLQNLLQDIYDLRQQGIILNTFIKVVGAHAAAARISPFRDTSDIDVIVSNARHIEDLLVKHYPTKYCLEGDLTEKMLYRRLGNCGISAPSKLPIDLISSANMPPEHPVTADMISIDMFPNAFDLRGFATLLDLIVLKIGSIVSGNLKRDAKKIWQDKLDLQQLVHHQNNVMQSLGRLLDATEFSGDDLHARYIFCYYDHHKIQPLGSTLRSWLFMSPSGLLNANGNIVLQYTDRAREWDKWESDGALYDDGSDSEF
ncbi:uncharacterized protein BT62DRAFT_1005440 [Guyanagaster necrorhizus]|uniref:Uncharacterized protein n=1 Tax=Guyanagaster necrorhizus TaxID=856835 RepID=A0A9P7VUY6_9AGAR|nr:uncharacterized protein BT62DRAFT_1005440 [Guyanagaster necrorhizus MCA 3950]KAG7447042.1 hypothetical protein BT62DRAFT_1005440 [Guyanagaster necrorhizus MCA 3950]